MLRVNRKGGFLSRLSAAASEAGGFRREPCRAGVLVMDPATVDLARLERVCQALEDRAVRAQTRLRVVCALARATGTLVLYGRHAFADGHVALYEYEVLARATDDGYLTYGAVPATEPGVVATELGDRMVGAHRFVHFARRHAARAWSLLARAACRQAARELVRLRANGRTHWLACERGREAFAYVRLDVAEVDLDAGHAP